MREFVELADRVYLLRYPVLDVNVTLVLGDDAALVVDTLSTAGQAAERALSVGGRAPLLWDNVPVNDAIMSDRLFLGPLRGREAALVEGLSGYLANAMVQPRASTLPLASTAAWLAGDDPVVAWATAAGDLGWRVLAEACDGGVPRALVGVLAATVGEPSWAGAAAAPAHDPSPALAPRTATSARGTPPSQASASTRQPRASASAAHAATGSSRRSQAPVEASGSVDARGCTMALAR